MPSTDLDRTIGDLTATLGDPTRRGIYILIRESAEPLTAAMVSEVFRIHPNVARHHLDRLAAEGYLRISRRRRSGRNGPGAGRPAKCYEVTDKEIRLQFPARRFDLLADLLVEVIETVAPEEAKAVAEQVGRRYGIRLATEIGAPRQAGFEGAVAAVARALTGVGFEASADPDQRMVVYRSCPFGQTAVDHPEVVCALDKGIVTGLMEAFRQDTGGVTTLPHARADEECVTHM